MHLHIRQNMIIKLQQQGFLQERVLDLLAPGMPLAQLISHRWDAYLPPKEIPIFPGLFVGGPVTETFQPAAIARILRAPDECS